MIRLAIVGVGGYGWNLIRWLTALRQPRECRLVAAADARLRDLPERARFLRAAGVGLFEDAMAMLRALRGRCDAVYVASSIPSHTALTVAAARCGCHVHLEKPPAATVQEVDEMLAALEAAGRLCLVGFQALHGRPLRLLIDRLASGRLGRARRLTCVAGWPRTRGYYRRNAWAGRLRRDGRWVLDGPATNALAHQLAHMLALAAGRPGSLAEPASVRAELYAAGAVEGHDTAAIEVRTAGGAEIRLLVSHTTATMFGPVIDVEAERGRAAYVHRKGATITYDDGTQETQPWGDEEGPEMVANFFQAIRSGDAAGLRCPLGEARKFVLALDGAHESSGRIHRIDPRHGHVRDGGTDGERTVVDGLDELLAAAGRQQRLLADLPDAPPWAVAARPFDLAGYPGFPQRFECE